MTDDSDLRADIRRLGVLLGQTLARQEGRPLLDLVEEVRGLVRTDGAAAARRLAEVDLEHRHPAGPCLLHLLPSGQHHRAGAPGPGTAPAARPTEGGWLDRAAELIRERGRRAGRGRRGRAPARRPAGVHRPPDRGGPPVDPGQAARDRRRARRARPPGPRLYGADAADAARPTGRLAELIDMLWQTDELRLTRPDPRDEARNAVYYLTRAGRGGRPAGARPTWTEILRRPRRRARPCRPAAHLRYLDRRRPGRQPVRDAAGDPRCAADPARVRHPRRSRRWWRR